MELMSKIKLLGAGAKYDNCGCSTRYNKKESMVRDALQHAIYETSAEGNRRSRLFKTLMSNACTFDCRYCLNSSECSNKGRGSSYAPQELARTFHLLRTRGYVDGLFLSSAITSDPDTMTERMIEAVSIIRSGYGFKGYIHLKILPGTSYDLVKRSSEIATRLSINIEAPNKSRISELSSTKDYRSDILRRQAWIRKHRPSAGQTTQMVVGAAEETDLEVLRMVEWEYRNMGLSRVYYSAFSPLKGTPLENKKAAGGMRERRIYNCDFLLRDYGYSMDEIRSVMDDGMLPREDPKVAIARQNFEGRLDVNDIKEAELVRIPGIGPSSARKITCLRESGERIESKARLKQCGVVLNRALPFLEIEGVGQRLINEF
ncbi:MAG: radical SAM protein [Candidatus Woesearchaeota archaeon]